MLLTEKKRAAWSVTVGLLVAGSTFAWLYFQIKPASVRVADLVANCKKSKTVPISPAEAKQLWFAKKSETINGEGHLVPVCEPSSLDLLADDAAKGVERDRTSAEQTGLIVFSVFCVPLAWYFLLDRIRDVSAAISGRDRPS